MPIDFPSKVSKALATTLQRRALMSKAQKSGWIVVSMKNDWNRILAFDK